MDNDKLQRATQLKESIESVEKQKKFWDSATEIRSVGVLWDYGNGFTMDNVQTKYINFDVLKALTLDTINKKLSELKNQYAEL